MIFNSAVPGKTLDQTVRIISAEKTKCNTLFIREVYKTNDDASHIF